MNLLKDINPDLDNANNGEPTEDLPVRFTEEQIIEWLGDPDWSYSGIVETFMDLANGDYTVENMRKDILETEDDY